MGISKRDLAVKLLFNENEEEEYGQIIPIRTETTLTKFPLHNLAKKTKIKIEQTRKSKRGKKEIIWEVKNPPGPLAYKIDSIIINRFIDEMRQRGDIRQLFKIGSLRSICEELGISPEGKNTQAIKEALKENAFAGITTKLEFIGDDGIERTFEFSTTRYGVIFTGQQLPNGKKADAVYIFMNSLYRDMLNHSKTRPLDYEYLKELSPAAQRLYELLSFSMFAAIKYDLPNTQILYSEICQYAPLTRYHDSQKMRSQMWKIHKQHLDSHYLKNVEFEETTDLDGNLDWIIRYGPGKKALREYKAFTTKKLLPLESKPLLTQSVKSILEISPDVQSATTIPQTDERTNALIYWLKREGIVEKKACELAAQHADECEIQLNALPLRNLSNVKNKAAWLIKAIIEHYKTPIVVERSHKSNDFSSELLQAEERYNSEERYDKALEIYNSMSESEKAKLKKQAETNWQKEVEEQTDPLLKESYESFSRLQLENVIEQELVCLIAKKHKL